MTSAENTFKPSSSQHSNYSASEGIIHQLVDYFAARKRGYEYSPGKEETDKYQSSRFHDY